MCLLQPSMLVVPGNGCRRAFCVVVACGEVEDIPAGLSGGTQLEASQLAKHI